MRGAPFRAPAFTAAAAPDVAGLMERFELPLRTGTRAFASFAAKAAVALNVSLIFFFMAGSALIRALRNSESPDRPTPPLVIRANYDSFVTGPAAFQLPESSAAPVLEYDPVQENIAVPYVYFVGSVLSG